MRAAPQGAVAVAKLGTVTQARGVNDSIPPYLPPDGKREAVRVLGTPGFLVNPSGTVRRVALAGIEVDERIRTGAAA